MGDEITKTYFSVHQVPFPKPENAKIRTREFLNASTSLVGLLEINYVHQAKLNYGSFAETLGKVFAPARYDMNGNIEKITKKFNEDQKKNEYVEDMLLSEKSEGKLFAIDAVMWLRRGLHFMLEFFEEIVNDETCREDLGGFVKTAYSKTLQKYHGWFGSNLFNLLARLVPQRQLIVKYIALNKENCDQYVVTDLRAFTANLRVCVEHLVEFYRANGLESEAKV